MLLQKDCRCWVLLICFYEGDSPSEGYQPKGCEQLTTEAYAFRSDVVLLVLFLANQYVLADETVIAVAVTEPSAQNW